MKINKKFKVLTMGLLLSVSIGALVGCSSNDTASNDNKNSAKYENIDAKETEDLLASGDDIAVVDVRGKDEYSTGHIDKAKNIDLNNFENNLTILDDYKEKPVLLYCNSGKKSEDAAKILAEHGFKKVYNAADGVKEHDYKLVK
ncbi:rhodanese-like domain-containing protein [Paraclostridium bifermentans]|uniref:rhodanese-like domain-containing protein n=1 Tax=Paraclostridium bifermentans TaxID=1490 RepID=UPI00359C51EC